MHGAIGPLIGMSAFGLLLGAPLLVGLAAIVWPRSSTPPTAREPGSGSSLSMIYVSTFFYTIAFNVVFFVQELFLVIPKAFYPGLEPTLFHNNHSWTGDAPIAQLFQGAGALAIFVLGIAAMAALKGTRGAAGQWRLGLFWIAQQGIVQSLPQVPSGVLEPGTDVGDAMNYLALPMPVQIAASFVAVGVMALALISLSGTLQEFAPPNTKTRGARIAFAVKAALLPALFAVPLIAPFRSPQQDLTHLLMPQLMFVVLGVPWLVGAAWLARREPVVHVAFRVDWKPVALAAAILAFFQLVLARGIDFF